MGPDTSGILAKLGLTGGEGSMLAHSIRYGEELPALGTIRDGKLWVNGHLMKPSTI